MTCIVPEPLDGARADAALAALADISRSAAQRLLEEGRVSADGKPVAKSAKLRAGQALDFELPPPVPAEPVPQDIPLDIVYEDDDLLVVNKPAGMVVHPAAGHDDGTLVNALLHHCGDSLGGVGGVLRPGIVHRIDRDTTGLLVVAKNDAAMESLAAELAAHHMERVYECIVRGHPDETGTLDAPIGRHPKDRKRMAVNRKDGKPAVTHYRVLEYFPGYSFVECRLETGRTHQIRVHMAHIGHPIVGDPVYNPGGESFGLTGQCLHAKTLCFRHPKTGETLKFTAELPETFRSLLTKLRARV